MNQGILRSIPNDLIAEFANWLNTNDLCLIYKTGDKAVWSRFVDHTREFKTTVIDNPRAPQCDMILSPSLRKLEYVDLNCREDRAFITTKNFCNLSQHLTHLSLKSVHYLTLFVDASSRMSAPESLFPNLTHLKLEGFAPKNAGGCRSLYHNNIVPITISKWPESLLSLTLICSSEQVTLENLPQTITELHLEGNVDLLSDVLPTGIIRICIKSSQYQVLGCETDMDEYQADLFIPKSSMACISYIDTNCQFVYVNIGRMPNLESLRCRFLAISHKMSNDENLQRIPSKLHTLNVKNYYDDDCFRSSFVARTLPLSVTNFSRCSGMDALTLLPQSFKGHVKCSQPYATNATLPPFSSAWVERLDE